LQTAKIGKEEDVGIRLRRVGRGVALSLLIAAAASGVTAGPARPFPSPFEVSWTDRSAFQAGLVSSAQGVLDRLPGATVYHLDVEIQDDLASLSGRAEILYTNCEEVPLTEVYFRLYPNAAGGEAAVRSVTVDGQDVEPVLESGGLDLRVPLPAPLPPGEAVEVGMEFEVKVPRNPGERYGLFSSFGGILSLDEAFPSIPVYDEKGWHLDPVLPAGDVAVCDTSLYLVRVSAPDRVLLVGAGVEVGREEVGGIQIVTFAAGPARDFYLAAGEDLVMVSRTVGETVIRSAAFDDGLPAAERVLDLAEAALATFGARLSPYPYTELDFVVNALLPGGSAMEYAGAVVLSRPLYDPNAFVWGSVPAPYALETDVVHETAHQWFFNVVGNDQVNEPWLDESLAQYATSLYFEDAYGPQGAQSYRRDWFRNWGRAGGQEIPIGLPVAAYAPGQYSPIVYGRGPLFLFDLSITMGGDVFAAFLQDYVTAFAWGIATTASFRALAETHCGCDLGPSFQAWVYPQE
jgi:hypothetical protein